MTTSPSKQCERCGHVFYAKKYKKGYGTFKRQRFCSLFCAATKDDPTRDAYNKRARKMIGPTCDECGTAEDLSIHHKDRNWRNNHVSNLTTLCASCHTSLHHEAGEINPKKERPPCRICSRPSARRDLCGKHLQREKKYGDPLLTQRWSDGRWRLVLTP